MGRKKDDEKMSELARGDESTKYKDNPLDEDVVPLKLKNFVSEIDRTRFYNKFTIIDKSINQDRSVSFKVKFSNDEDVLPLTMPYTAPSAKSFQASVGFLEKSFPDQIEPKETTIRNILNNSEEVKRQGRDGR